MVAGVLGMALTIVQRGKQRRKQQGNPAKIESIRGEQDLATVAKSSETELRICGLMASNRTWAWLTTLALLGLVSTP
jgi:hypothetical protein